MKSKIKFAIVFFIFIIFIGNNVIAQQQKVAVFFEDKPSSNFNPYNYFDAKAIARRLKHNVPLISYSDLPVNTNYVEQIEQITSNIKGVSRWLNVVFTYATEEQLKNIEAFSFVSKIEIISPAELQMSSIRLGVDVSTFTDWEKLREKQLNRMGASFFEAQNINGKGVRIAVFDAGFPYVNKHEAFKHLFEGNKIIKTYDFVSNKENVYRANSHGAMCLSNIAGISSSGPLGLATQAEFLLARTEYGFIEPFSEEENWLMAAEWADKNGADIISSSLGYTHKRYETSEMDGKTSFVAEAARWAVRKGILVVNAAGNEGTDAWKTIGTPADVDSVLTVGGVSPQTDFHVNFSSYGPNSMLQLKPNVSAFGVAAVASKGNTYKTVSGTSFATPLTAGFAACVLQLNPNLTNMELFKMIEKSGHLYPYYDYAHGYGVPQASYITQNLEPTKATFKLTENNLEYFIEVEEEFTAEKSKFSSDDYIYYHFADKNGAIKKYAVIKVESKSPLSFLKENIHQFEVLKIHYKGYTLTKDLKAFKQ